MSEIKVSDQRGRRLSGRRSVEFTKQKCGRELRNQARWRKPLEGVHFWRANVAKVWKGAAVPTTMAPNHWKAFTFGVEMLQTCGRERGYQHDGAKSLEGVHVWSGNEAKVLEGIAKRLLWE